MRLKKFMLPALIVLVFVLAITSMINPVSNSVTGNFASDITGEKNLIILEDSSIYFNAGKLAGKSHDGTFQDWEAFVYTQEGKIVGFEGVAQVSSIKTDNERVDAHLQRDDFFDVNNYPEIKFTSTSIDLENNQFVGVMQYAGKQKEISGNLISEGNKVTGNLVIDGNDLDFKYEALITEVLIEFELAY